MLGEGEINRPARSATIPISANAGSSALRVPIAAITVPAVFEVLGPETLLVRSFKAAALAAAFE